MELQSTCFEDSANTNTGFQGASTKTVSMEEASSFTLSSSGLDEFLMLRARNTSNGKQSKATGFPSSLPPSN